MNVADVLAFCRHFLGCAVVAGLVLGPAASAWATEVVLAGVFPGKALLVIDGRAPRAVAAGAATPDGVRVLTVEGDSATVEVDGRRQRLVVGQSAVRVGGDGAGAASVELQADSAGHFSTYGAVNGAQVRFLVDTGASLVVLGRSDALRAGID